ncbi:glycosyltransferase family 2 protein [Blastococcus sp. Marseille-P5729]|uniref:glycosyltransferase n=1 Tax=Blastococcus sp. Marseille-P5729 TaxID=2086582 RepID=UPI00131D9FF4|nr:glycosyltransferase [Blastococcus sp. Marseille-P5729]
MTPPRMRPRVLVAIPAHNEQLLLGRALEAAVQAVDDLRSQCPFDISIGVSAHRCTDDTFAVAGARLASADGVDVTVLRDKRSRTVGGVRRRLINAMLTPGMHAPTTWLLSTDADSIVPPQWISQMLQAAAREDAVAVAGMTDLVDWSANAQQRAAYDHIVEAGLTDDGGHRHVYAANLAVRLDAYLAAGGFPSVAHGEEHHLIEAIRAAGGTVATPRHPRVRTSGRMPGRAAHGLGDLLATL